MISESSNERLPSVLRHGTRTNTKENTGCQTGVFLTVRRQSWPMPPIFLHKSIHVLTSIPKCAILCNCK